jgi:hypothetical protein
MTALLFPILLKDIGTDLLLLILVATSLLGAVVTWAYAFETKGVSLEKIDEKAALTTPSPRRAIKIWSSAPSGDHA